MKRRLRILVAHNVSRERTGGMSRLMGYAHDEIVGAGHSVDYLCTEDLPPRFRGASAKFVFPALILKHGIAAARAGCPYDIVNVHEPSGAAISLFKRYLGGTRVIATSYGVEKRSWERVLEEVSLGRDTVGLRSRISVPATRLWQSRITLSRADHVFCSNMEDHDYLISRFRIPSQKITRMHSGAHRIYAELNGPRDYNRGSTLLFAASWLKRKGVLDLIPAFVRLADTHPGLRLVVLNGGVPEDVIKQNFPEGIRSRVICQSARPEREIAVALSAADIYLLPSLFEGTPLTLIEAMFAGMPIVTTATCGMRDVIEHGKNGLLVPLRSPGEIVDAVESLLCNPGLRAELGQAAQAEAILKYSWDRVAEPIRRVYEDLCA